jgi:hypothetical protein
MRREPEILKDIDSHLKDLGVPFTTKPLVFGGAAMAYYGLRTRGHDIDFIVSFEDYETALRRYPGGKKDLWGDWGVVAGEFELFRTVWKLDLAYLSTGAAELPQYRIISIDRLLLMKALAMNTDEKNKADFDLVLKYIMDQNQRKDVLAFMNAHVQSYLGSPDQFVYNDRYID